MAFVYGTGKSDTLNALDGVTNGADLIFGLGGNDRIYGLGGDDEIMGGHGADYINGGSGIDTASYGDSGTGVLVSLISGRVSRGTAEGDTLVSIENLTGSAHDDDLDGNDGVNVLRGMGGVDVINGFGGADTIYGGDDVDILLGAAGNDILHGEAGNDDLNGGLGDDTLNGEAGNDLLRGDAGRDTLAGGTGGDTFMWAFSGDTGNNAYTADVIADFNIAEGDRIDVHFLDANLVASGNQAFTFIGNAALSGTPGEINYVHWHGNTLIQLQTDASPDAEEVIRLVGIHTPEASWFVL